MNDAWLGRIQRKRPDSGQFMSMKPKPYAADVAFDVSHFVFAAAAHNEQAYTSRIRRAPPLRNRIPELAKDARSNTNDWKRITAMKLVARFFRARREANLTTALERARLSRTMPGQTAALAASRYGYIVN